MSSQYPFRVVFSNEMQALGRRLGEEFFLQGGLPFENRLVVVPDIAMKDFLLEQFVAHPQLKMAAGVRILPLNQAVAEILDQVFREGKKKIPSSIEIALALEEKLHAASDPFLQGYLQGNAKRIAGFSDEIAKLFVRYGLHGSSFLSEWLKKQGWQQTLWRCLFEESSWTYPVQALSTVQAKRFPGKLALFGFSYLTQPHLKFFASLGASLYHLSPSRFFWGDMVSDKQRSRILKIREEMEEYMREDHPLLGNWGKIGRKMLGHLDNFSLVDEEIYKEQSEDTQLDRIKKSMLDLEPFYPSNDDSLQLHSATSRLSEVEALRDFLAAHSFTPSEVLVLCPDISTYLPYIQMVFSQTGLPIAIRDIPIAALSPALQGFFQLLALKEEKFAFASVLKLLQNGSLLEKWDFAPDEMERICRWLQAAEVREKLSFHPNSWEEGLERLILGIAFSSYESCIPGSEIDLFDRFLELFDQIKCELKFDGKKSAAGWLKLFSQMSEKFFAFDKDGESFFHELRSLSQACQALDSPVWDFDSIHRVLTKLSQKPSGEISSSHVEKITFASLRSGVVKPAKLIWCLGMDEGAFPRLEPHSSLNEMPLADFPGRGDEDRALFLDLLLKAKEKLIFSYQRIHPDDGKAQGASSLIEELKGITVVDHPALSFSPRKVEGRPFFRPGLSILGDELLQIDIRQLKKLAGHPLKFFFHETLKIYLEEEEDREEKEFLLSNLRKSILRKKGSRREIPLFLQQLRQAGKLPSGLFQDAACRDLEREIEDLVDTLQGFSISADEVRSVPMLPPLKVNLSSGKCIHLVGRLEDVSPKGLLFHGESDLKSLVKAWPLFLVYLALKEGEAKLILTKSGKALSFPPFDAENALSAYIDYFLQARQSPSPLLPDWAAPLLQKTEEDFAKAMQKERRFEDVYLDYLQRRHGPFESKETFQRWSGPLRKVFAPLLEGCQ